MEKFNDYFYGYMQFAKDAYKRFPKLYNPSQGKYDLNSTILATIFVRVQIDNEWLEAFEEYFPYIDNCIRELRSFLYKEDEIVIVELANKVDVTQTLGYLLQNTSAILEYDETTGELTPGSLVNTTYESTYNIYENLFIYTLVHRCVDFIYSFYNDIEDIYNKEQLTIMLNQMQKNADFQSTSDIDMNLDYERILDKRITSDGGEVNGIVRLLDIKNQLSEFLDSQLMKSLKGSKYISDPLTMTNVLLKNPNFIKAVEFWNFLNKYNGEKIKIQKMQRRIKMTRRIMNDLFEVNNMLNFLLRLSLDDKFRTILRLNYKDRLLEEEKERKAEQARQLALKRGEIKEAVKKQIEKDNLAVKKLVAKYEEKLARFKEFFGEKDFNAIERCNEIVYKLRESNKATLEKTVKDLQERFAAEKEAGIAKLQAIIDDLRNNKEAEIAEIINEQEAKLSAVNKFHNKELADMQNQVNKQLEHELQNFILKEKNLAILHQDAVNKLNAQHESMLESVKEEHEKQLVIVNNQHAQEIITLNEKNTNKLDTLKKKHGIHTQSIVKTARSKYESLQRNRDDLIKKYEKNFALYTAKNAKRIDDIEISHKKEQIELRTKMSNLKVTQKKVLKGLITDNKAKIARVKASNETTKKRFEDNIAALKLKNQRKEEALESSMEKQKSGYESTIASIRVESEKQIESLISENEAKIVLLQSANEKKLAEQSTASEQKLVDQKQYYENKIVSKEQESQKQIDSIESKYGQEIEQIKTEYEHQSSAIINNYEKNIAAERKATAKEMDTLNKTHNKTIATMTREQKKETTSLTKQAAKDSRLATREQNKLIKQLNDKEALHLKQQAQSSKQESAKIEQLKKEHSFEKTKIARQHVAQIEQIARDNVSKESANKAYFNSINKDLKDYIFILKSTIEALNYFRKETVLTKKGVMSIFDLSSRKATQMIKVLLDTKVIVKGRGTGKYVLPDDAISDVQAIDVKDTTIKVGNGDDDGNIGKIADNAGACEVKADESSEGSESITTDN